MSRPKPCRRWYLSCIRGEDGTFAAHVLRCRWRATGLAPYGLWVPEDDERHLSSFDLWEPGRFYRNKQAVYKAIRQLVARFPGIRLEMTRQDRGRRSEQVWTVGANPYRK